MRTTITIDTQNPDYEESARAIRSIFRNCQQTFVPALIIAALEETVRRKAFKREGLIKVLNEVLKRED